MGLAWVKKHLYVLGGVVLGATIVLSSTIPPIIELASTNKISITFSSKTDFTQNKYRDYFDIDGPINDATFQDDLASVPYEGWCNEAAFMITRAIKECTWFDFFAAEWSGRVYGLYTDTAGPNNHIRLSFWSEVTFLWPKNNKYQQQIYKLRFGFKPSVLTPAIGKTGIYKSDKKEHRETVNLPFNHDWVEITDGGSSGGGVWVLSPDNESSLIFADATFVA